MDTTNAETTVPTSPSPKPPSLKPQWAAVLLAVLLPLVTAGATSRLHAEPTPDSPEKAKERPNAEFPWEREQFYYSLRVNGAEALRATLKVGSQRNSERGTYVPVAMNVRSLGFFHNIYPVNDRADTFLNPETFRPYRSEKIFRENGKQRTYAVNFDHGRFRAAVRKTKPDYVRTFKEPIPSSTHDMISWMYELRTREIAVGKEFQFYVFDGWKISDVRLKVVGKEDLYTPAGWFKTWKFKFVRKIVRTKSQKGENGDPTSPLVKVKTPKEHAGNLWLSRDANHLPLRVTINTGWGYGEAVLIRYDSHSEE